MSEILRRHAFSLTFLVILFGYLFFSAGDDIQRFAGFTMGTTYNVQVVGLPDEPPAAEVAGDIERLLNHLDREVFSTYAPDSELSRFNRHGVAVPFAASQEMIEVLSLAGEISVLTGGAFDVTVGPLVNLWGFGPEPGPAEDTVPDDGEIASALQRVGYEYLSIDAAASEISKGRELYVDLSAVAKGYAVDRLAAYLDELGVSSYFLDVGGELKMRGLKPDGSSWIPAIETPDVAQSRIYEVFFSRGDTMAVAGSGDYRNYFELDGVRYSHEIDPRTGRPVRHNLAAAYVIDDSAARADALATAFMVMGLEESRQLASAQGQAVYLIYKPRGEGADFEPNFEPNFEHDFEYSFEHYVSNQFSQYLND
ncbi:MAG: FAD:protein FMN transferase [Pseudohongiellaceae bacterium]